MLRVVGEEFLRSMARNEAHIVDKGDKIVDHIVVVQEQRRRPVTI